MDNVCLIMVYSDGNYLVADTLDELHLFADSIDMKREWFFGGPDYCYYKVSGCKVSRAFKYGAKPCTSFKIISCAIGLAKGMDNPLEVTLYKLDALLEFDGYRRNSELRSIIKDILSKQSLYNNTHIAVRYDHT